MSTKFTWHGQRYKISYIATVDKGNFYTLFEWSDVAGWTRLADSRPPINLSGGARETYVTRDFGRWFK